MKVVSLLVVGAASSSFEEIAEHINSGNFGWTAQAPAKFASLEDVPEYLGAFLPGEEGYSEPEVVELPPLNADLPAEFDAATQWPQCSVIRNVRDQANCGSCWAFGSVSSFESRRCIATGEDIKFSPEDTAFCQPLFGAGMGCNGGNSAWSWFVSHGVVTGGDYTDRGNGDMCLPYSFAPCAHHVPATEEYPACPDEIGSPKCMSACSEDGYSGTYSQDKVKAATSYSVRALTNSGTVQKYMQDLVENGPMYVTLSVYGDFPTYKSGVYTHQTGSYLGGHAVTLVGYGTLDGQDYWKIKNSWNEQWGMAGHILIARGQNECGIEGGASAGTFDATVSV